MRLSLEDLIEHFYLDNVNLSRFLMETLVNIYEPDTAELLALDERARNYIVRHMFNKSQRERYYLKRNNYLFAEIVMSCVI